MVRLKKLANAERRWPMVFVVTVWILLTYGIPNKFLLFHPTPVPTVAADSWIGFSPGWVWAYVSYYVILLVPYLVAKEEDVMDQMIYSYVAAGGLSCLFFLFFPTVLPRDLYPTDHASDFMSVLALNVIRIIDNPLNCFPSMHVTLTTIATLTWLRSSRRWAWIALPWGLAIYYSTVATKQHYALDVAGGLVFGLATFWFFANCVYVNDGSDELATAVGKKNQP